MQRQCRQSAFIGYVLIKKGKCDSFAFLKIPITLEACMEFPSLQCRPRWSKSGNIRRVNKLSRCMVFSSPSVKSRSADIPSPPHPKAVLIRELSRLRCFLEPTQSNSQVTLSAPKKSGNAGSSSSLFGNPFDTLRVSGIMFSKTPGDVSSLRNFFLED